MCISYWNDDELGRFVYLLFVYKGTTKTVIVIRGGQTIGDTILHPGVDDFNLINLDFSKLSTYTNHQLSSSFKPKVHNGL